MNRHQLDAFSRRHLLPPPAIATALALTGLQPDASSWRAFAVSLLQAAGLGAVGAGVLFFVAANWQDYGLFGRFALLQCALLISIGVALWKPPAQPIGQAALVLATLLTGGLLALFGQSYQTGADVHELFFTWALLALPFAVAGLSGALWALWWAVLNIGLALLCGWVGPEHFFWHAIAGRGIGQATLLMLPCVVNLAAAGLFLRLHGSRFNQAAPTWLTRFLASLGVLYGTIATLSVVVGSHWRGDGMPTADDGAAVVLCFTALCVAIGAGTWRRRRDVFPMALLAASWIAISTTWLAHSLRINDLGSFFLIAFWLIATSTGAGMVLMHWSRAWQAAGTPQGAGAVA